MKIWNTKYCLTDGITTHEAKVTENDMAVIPKTKESFVVMLHGEGRDWHKTLESAIERAEEVRIKKLQSLERSMKKISAINFKG